MVFLIGALLFLAVSVEAGTFATIREAARPADSLLAIKTEAERGNARSQKLYGDNLKASLKFAAAEHWYRQAALQGDAAAQGALAVLYHTSMGIGTNAVKGNYSQALVLHQLAASQGYAPSHFHLYFAHNDGKVYPRNLVLAYKHLLLAELPALSTDSYAKRLIQEMSQEQIIEAKRLAKEFKPAKFEKAFSDLAFSSIKFSGSIGSNSERFALLNGAAILPGQFLTLNLGGLPARIRCDSVASDSVTISYGSLQRTLKSGTESK